MFFHVLCAPGRSESNPMTMPRMGLKSDGGRRYCPSFEALNKASFLFH
jgi:hypothetical protein